MTWVARNQERIEKIRAYVLAFQSAKPGLFAYFEGGAQPVFPMAPGSDRGVALLLTFTALYQGIGEEKLVRVLAYLWRHYEADIFRLNKLPFDPLQEKLQALTDLQDWTLWSKSPGILRSACDFFFRHGRLVPWVYAQGDGEACIQILAEEVFLMGKTSPFKTKARYFLWLLTQLPDVQPERFWSAKTQAPLSKGHIRFLRELGPLKERKSVPWVGAEEKLDYFNRFYHLLFPGKTWMAFAALDAFLKPSPGDIWACRRVIGTCGNCALVDSCPGKVD